MVFGLITIKIVSLHTFTNIPGWYSVVLTSLCRALLLVSLSAASCLSWAIVSAEPCNYTHKHSRSFDGTDKRVCENHKETRSKVYSNKTPSDTFTCQYLCLCLPVSNVHGSRYHRQSELVFQSNTDSCEWPLQSSPDMSILHCIIHCKRQCDLKTQLIEWPGLLALESFLLSYWSPHTEEKPRRCSAN